MKKTFLLLLLAGSSLSAQGLVELALRKSHGSADSSDLGPKCGSHLLLLEQDLRAPGYLEAANEALITTVKEVEARAKSIETATLTIPVVFHVVYNNAEENLPDSVIQNQLNSLNLNYSRLNADTSTLRSEFLPYAGNPNIRFELATTAPDGSPTTGIVRKTTNIAHFGGVLPFNANQTAQIQQWVADSLFYNLSRISQDSLGGSNAWDTERYLNIWIGDLRIFEPQINNFEELVFLGLAKPPVNHPNFAGTGLDSLVTEVGVIMHYVAIGPNNTASFPAPYQAFNSNLDEGDLLSHEVGHYLALRHIWGDGNCSLDDYIQDTPPSNNSNQFTCNKSRNSCLDSIGGVNLPDMVENFMDYSSDACLNSFTKQQAAVMRATLFNYRPNLFSIGLRKTKQNDEVYCYPNPTTGKVKLQIPILEDEIKVRIYTNTGNLLKELFFNNLGEVELDLGAYAGLYIIKVFTSEREYTFKILKT